MNFALFSKFSEMLQDPVQRHWHWGRLRKKWAAPAEFTPHKPPYLTLPVGGGDISVELSSATLSLADLAVVAPTEPFIVVLPGAETIQLKPNAAVRAFSRHTDHSLAAVTGLHAFTWLTSSPDMPPAWVAALWSSWTERYREVEPLTLPWRARIAAERAVILLDYARRVGLPGPRAESVAMLANHVAAILAGLDYWGEQGTGSDLALEGHALYRLGLDLGLPTAVKAGMTILLEEHKRLFGSSGVLLEDSIGRHMLLTRSYVDAWLAARRHARSEAADLCRIAARLLAVIPAMTLSGGLPRIGDDNPGLPLSYLNGLIRGESLEQGWTGQLPAAEQAAVAHLRDENVLNDVDALRQDGWLRLDLGAWSGLWHAAPEGWLRVSGHGHQDFGAPELHYEGVPLFVDPGSPDGGTPQWMAVYRSVAAHGGLDLNGIPPYPESKSDYTAAFRRAICGAPPVLRSEYDGASLAFQGFSRMGGPLDNERRWRLAEDGLTLEDIFKGTGQYRLTRRLITPFAAVIEDGAVILSAGELRFKISAEVPAVLHAGHRRGADNRQQALQVVEFSGRINLPWRGTITVRRL